MVGDSPTSPKRKPLPGFIQDGESLREKEAISTSPLQ
jgi:hypothetical protein